MASWMMRMLSASVTGSVPICEPPSPKADTVSPVLPSLRYSISPRSSPGSASLGKAAAASAAVIGAAVDGGASGVPGGAAASAVPASPATPAAMPVMNVRRSMSGLMS